MHALKKKVSYNHKITEHFRGQRKKNLANIAIYYIHIYLNKSAGATRVQPPRKAKKHINYKEENSHEKRYKNISSKRTKLQRIPS